MRAIKFRGKDLSTGQWYYGDLIHGAAGKTFIATATPINLNADGTIDSNAFLPEVDPDTVGQFTGLIDCNGKEIYEGDIMKSPSEFSPILWVFFDENICAFSFIEETPIGAYLNAFPDFCVIGNIHDNLELLKGGKQ